MNRFRCLSREVGYCEQCYSWVKRVEKLGKYKVRIVSKKVNSVDLGNMVYRIVMWGVETMAKLDKVSDYGRLSPVGTGSYKVLQATKTRHHRRAGAVDLLYRAGFGEQVGHQGYQQSPRPPGHPQSHRPG